MLKNISELCDWRRAGESLVYSIVGTAFMLAAAMLFVSVVAGLIWSVKHFPVVTAFVIWVGITTSLIYHEKR